MMYTFIGIYKFTGPMSPNWFKGIFVGMHPYLITLLSIYIMRETRKKMGIEKYVGFSPKIYSHPWFINDKNEDMHSVEWDYYGAPKKETKKDLWSWLDETLKDEENPDLKKETKSILDSFKRFFFILIPDFLPLKMTSLNASNY